MDFSLQKLGAIASDPSALGPTVKVAVFGPSNNTPAMSAAEPPDEAEEYTGTGAVCPPHSFEACLAAFNASTRLHKLGVTFARNTVGLGWFLEPLPSAIETDGDPTLDPETRRQDVELTAFFNMCNPEMPLSEVCERAAIDREATGNGFLEVTRNLKQVVSGIFHMPCLQVRVRRTVDMEGNLLEGFVQALESYGVRGGSGRFIYFKKYGDLRPMNKWTGQYQDDVDAREAATELIHWKVYAPDSYYYGKPRWLTALPAIFVSQQARVWNLNFVSNNASWPLAIITENGELDPASQQLLTDVTAHKGKGLNGAGKVIFLQAQKKHPAFRNLDTRIRIEKLAMGVTDDGSFLKLLKNNDDEIRETYGINELFLGSANDLNRASASVSRQVTNEQEFVPQQRRDEFIMDIVAREVVAALGFESAKVRFRFARPRTTDNLQDSQILSRLGGQAVMDGQELRRVINKYTDLGLPPKDTAWASMPPSVFGREAAARTAAVAASSNPDSPAADVLEETRLDQIKQALDDALEDARGEE